MPLQVIRCVSVRNARVRGVKRARECGMECFRFRVCGCTRTNREHARTRAHTRSAQPGLFVPGTRAPAQAMLAGGRQGRSHVLGAVRMSNVKGVARNEDIMQVAQLAKKPLPNR